MTVSVTGSMKVLEKLAAQRRQEDFGVLGRYSKWPWELQKVESCLASDFGFRNQG